jgi:hypothetical protein
MSEQPQKLPVEVEDESALGPAMQRLTPQRREFVRGMVDGLTQKEAARRAGYSPSQSTNALEVRGTVLMRRLDIHEAIREETNKLLCSAAPKSVAVLIKISLNEAARDRDRIMASLALLDRGGYGAMSSHRLDIHHHEPSRAEVKARLAAACDELGFSPEMKARALRVSSIELAEQPDGSFAAKSSPAEDSGRN